MFTNGDPDMALLPTLQRTHSPGPKALTIVVLPWICCRREVELVVPQYSMQSRCSLVSHCIPWLWRTKT